MISINPFNMLISKIFGNCQGIRLDDYFSKASLYIHLLSDFNCSSHLWMKGTIVSIIASLIACYSGYEILFGAKICSINTQLFRDKIMFYKVFVEDYKFSRLVSTYM